MRGTTNVHPSWLGLGLNIDVLHGMKRTFGVHTMLRDSDYANQEALRVEKGLSPRDLHGMEGTFSLNLDGQG